jgi:hypothetical protein
LTFDCCSQKFPIPLLFQSQFLNLVQTFWDWYLTGFLSILSLLSFSLNPFIQTLWRHSDPVSESLLFRSQRVFAILLFDLRPFCAFVVKN